VIDRIIIEARLFRCKKNALPESICRYLHLNRKKIPAKTPLADIRFVVFDTETTGFDIKHDKIISIGAVSLKAQRIDVSDSFEVLVRQDNVGARDAVSVHGLLRKDIATGVDERTAVTGFLDYIGNSVLVAQHAGFDIAMVNNLLGRHFGVRLFNDVIDTASLAKRLEKGPYYNLAHKAGEYKLDALCERYNIRLHDRHTSAGDAYLTAQLYQRLLAKSRLSGIENAGTLLMK
jgi:DNA polymerase-3 subunit epsilon